MSYGRVTDACGVCGRFTFDEFNIPILETGGSYLCEPCMAWADAETNALVTQAAMRRRVVRKPRDTRRRHAAN